MTHRTGGRTQNLFLSAHSEIGSGLPMGIEIWGSQVTTRGAEYGVPKGVILGAQNGPKMRVSPMVYLHAGLETQSAVPYAIHWESNRDSHVLGPQGSDWALAW